MNKKQIYNRLMEVIGNPIGVIGFMANFAAESGFKSTNMQNSYEKKLGMNDATYTAAVDNGTYTNFVFDGVGYGFAQWTSCGRKNALLNFARARGVSIGNAEMQLEFAIYELTTGYKSTLKKLQKATTVKEASDYVCKNYERPADQSEKALKKRSDYGLELYEELVGAESEELPMNVYRKGVKVQLSENFKSTEFDCNGKGCCTETPIDLKLVEVLQNIRDHFGVSVNLNCGYRCSEHNAKVSGASKNSQHMKGIAADIVAKGVHPYRVARYIETIPGFAGRIGCYTWNAKGDGFVHVDVRGKNSRGLYTENNTKYDSLSTFTKSIKRGAKGRHVIVVQRLLADVGLYKGKIDGKCGAGMEKAIVKWNEMFCRYDDKSWGRKCWEEAFPIC